MARKMQKADSGARSAVVSALSIGMLTRLPCEVCGAEPTHAHHDDYLRPLAVRWLCLSHHFRWHRENGPGANRDVMVPYRMTPQGRVREHLERLRADTGAA